MSASPDSLAAPRRQRLISGLRIGDQRCDLEFDAGTGRWLGRLLLEGIPCVVVATPVPTPTPTPIRARRKRSTQPAPGPPVVLIRNRPHHLILTPSATLEAA